MDPIIPGGNALTMDANRSAQIPAAQPQNATADVAQPIGQEQIRQAMQRLRKYKDGKVHLEMRVKSSQQWWKLRNWQEIELHSGVKGADAIKPASAWLWNCIVGKHADAIDSFPEPVVLPRMQDDHDEARKLSSIIPVVLEQNDFEEVYSECTWQKMLEGTAIYGCYWDQSKNGGLGDVTIRRVDVLNLFWQPGITDIQQSREIFHVELVDNAAIDQRYPQMSGKHKGDAMSVSKFAYDDNVDTSDKSLVVDWYYHKWVSGKKILHFCKFCGEEVLESTENDPQTQDGLYSDGDYPFVFDRLFPVYGSPCGYGYIDIGKGVQELIDVINQAMAKNAAMAATPRFFVRKDGSINEEEFADWSKPFVHCNSNLGSDTIAPISIPSIPTNTMEFLQAKIDELKFVTGNMDINNGGTMSGVTAASAIAALQETGGRSSKASTKSAYRAYGRLVTMVIERIRQFYDMPRTFRILGDMGRETFTNYDNSGIVPKAQGVDFGVDMGYRLPVFDIDVRAQKENPYTKMSQNELAVQLYQMGALNPQMSDMALMMIGMMDFKGKDELCQKIAQNGTMAQELALYQQLALQLAQQVDPQMAQGLASKIAQEGGMPAAQPTAPGTAKTSKNAKIDEEGKKQNAIVENARARAQQAAQPAQ